MSDERTAHRGAGGCRAFGRVVDYVESDARRTESVAMEKIVREHPTLNASYLERVSRMQELMLDEVRTRTGRSDPADPRTAAVVGAAFSCLIAAWTTGLPQRHPDGFVGRAGGEVLGELLPEELVRAHHQLFLRREAPDSGVDVGS